MKTSFVVATLVVVGAGAAGAGALFPISPYQGSDTEFDITNQVMINTTLGVQNDYVGGGSGAGENAMTATNPVQRTAPMSKMMTSTTCNVKVGSYSHASGLPFGLDGLSVYSYLGAGGTTACNGPNDPSGDNTGKGLNYTTGVAGGAGDGGNTSFPNWTNMLALLYGGLDKTTGIVDCASPKRKSLVANWSNLFQDQVSCGSNPVTTCNTAAFSALQQHRRNLRDRRRLRE
jgi:hypothetical protein